MALLILIVVISGGLLFIDRSKYILSDQAKALCWFVFVLHVLLLIGSFFAGKPMYFNIG